MALPQIAPRLFVGCNRGRDDAVVALSDGMGRTRLRMVVDSLGAARIEFLNDSGLVVKSLTL